MKVQFEQSISPVVCSNCGRVALTNDGIQNTLYLRAHKDGTINLILPDDLVLEGSKLLCEHCRTRACPDCMGGKYPNYCPACNEWHEHGDVCLHCGTQKIVCPTCSGKGSVRGDLPKTTTIPVAPFSTMEYYPTTDSE